MSTVIPELKLYQIVEALIDEVSADYNRHLSKENTMLYHLFGSSTKVGKYNYFDQAVDLFVNRGVDHPRKMKVRMMFDAAQAGMPTIHITTPSEQPQFNTIGIGESGRSFVENTVEGTVTPNYNRRFKSQFYIVCTSENAQEVFLMYHVLMASMVQALDYINLAGLENPELSGQEIRQQDHLAPNHIYMRGVGLSCFRQLTVPRYFDNKVISDIILDNPIPANQ